MSALGVKPLVMSIAASKSPRATHRLPTKLQHSPYAGQPGPHDPSPSTTTLGGSTHHLILQRPSNVIGGQRRAAPPLILDGNNNLMLRQGDGVQSGSQSYRMLAGLGGNREQSPLAGVAGGPSA
jgi:hypothetical protein